MSLTAYGADETPSEQPEPLAAPFRRVEREHISGPAVATARALLGLLLVRDGDDGRCVARIVETEAYDGPHDRASHSRAGRTPRTEVMFGPPGHAYVYLVYGMHHCLNVVCGPDGEAAAVLIRAVQPVSGLEAMRARRGSAAGPDERLAAGPARTCQALDIDRGHDGLDLVTDEGLWLAIDDEPRPRAGHVISGPRIGVDYAGIEWASKPWRFGLADSPALSRPFPPRD